MEGQRTRNWGMDIKVYVNPNTIAALTNNSWHVSVTVARSYATPNNVMSTSTMHSPKLDVQPSTSQHQLLIPQSWMFNLLLTVLTRDYSRGGGGTVIPVKDCQYKGEHPNLPKPQPEMIVGGLGFRV